MLCAFFFYLEERIDGKLKSGIDHDLLSCLWFFLEATYCILNRKLQEIEQNFQLCLMHATRADEGNWLDGATSRLISFYKFSLKFDENSTLEGLKNVCIEKLYQIKSHCFCTQISQDIKFSFSKTSQQCRNLYSNLESFSFVGCLYKVRAIVRNWKLQENISWNFLWEIESMTYV